MEKVKKLFTRQSILCIFLVALMSIMAVLTLKDIFFDKRDSAKETYSSLLKDDEIKVVTIAKTCVKVLRSVDDYNPLRTAYINLYGLTQKAVNNRYVSDPTQAYSDVMRLDNGQLCYVGTMDDTIAETAANNLTRLKKVLDKKEIGLLYVTAPYKTNPDAPGLQVGVDDWQNEKIVNVQKALAAAEIDNINLIDDIKAQKFDFSSLFFNTDHHWKPSTALWAAQRVSKYLNDNYDFDIDLSLLDKNNFSSKMYENIFLGSQGKKVGLFYGGVDDFELLTPKYDTDLTFWFLRLNGKNVTRSGSFDKSLLFKENLKRDFFNENVYVTYSGGDYIKTCITNHNIHNGKRILLVRDSFSCTFAPFFALASCEQLFTIDLRHFEGSLLNFIDEIDPEIVIYLEHPYFNEVKQEIK